MASGRVWTHLLIPDLAESRAIGNFLFGMRRVQNLIGSQVNSQGWFRRGIMPWMDLVKLETTDGTVVNSYHRFWSFLLGFGAIFVGLFLGLT